MQSINCSFFFQSCPEQVNPVNKLYSLAYKVQQTSFIPAKKNMNLVNNIHSFIFAINHIQIQQQYTEIYNTLEIIYTILTKLFTKSNV